MGVATELCEVIPGQLYKRKVPEYLTVKIIEFAKIKLQDGAKIKPQDRFTWKYTNSKFLLGSFIKITIKPLGI